MRSPVGEPVAADDRRHGRWRRQHAQRRGPDGLGHEPADRFHVPLQLAPVDAQVVHLLDHHLARDAFQEEVQRDDHDRDVIEPADDRDEVRDQVDGRDDICRGDPEHHLTRRRDARVEQQLHEQSAVERARATATGRKGQKLRTVSPNSEGANAAGMEAAVYRTLADCPRRHGRRKAAALDNRTGVRYCARAKERAR